MNVVPLDTDEKILYEIRKHPFAFYMEMTGIFAIAVLPVIAYGIISALYVGGISEHTESVFMFGYLILLLFIWITTFISWTDFYSDTWIITDKRIIDFELNGLFKRDIASVNLENVQDVKIKISGLIATWLQIGEVHIQTSGAEKEFALKQAHMPEAAKTAILKAVEARKQLSNN